jgi:hypothetical protein
MTMKTNVKKFWTHSLFWEAAASIAGVTLGALLRIHYIVLLFICAAAAYLICWRLESRWRALADDIKALIPLVVMGITVYMTRFPALPAIRNCVLFILAALGAGRTILAVVRRSKRQVARSSAPTGAPDPTNPK